MLRSLSRSSLPAELISKAALLIGRLTVGLRLPLRIVPVGGTKQLVSPLCVQTVAVDRPARLAVLPHLLLLRPIVEHRIVHGLRLELERLLAKRNRIGKHCTVELWLLVVALWLLASLLQLPLLHTLPAMAVLTRRVSARLLKRPTDLPRSLRQHRLVREAAVLNAVVP